MTRARQNQDPSWPDKSPFGREFTFTKGFDLGNEGNVHLRLQNADELTGYGAMHGGAIAAASALAAKSVLNADDGPTTTVTTHLVYARPGRGVELDVHTQLLRRARELRYIETELVDHRGRRARELRYIETELVDHRGRRISHASTVLTAGPSVHYESQTSLSSIRGGGAALNDALSGIPFLADRGLQVAGVCRGGVEITMQPVRRNADGVGSIHEGAVLTLIDLAGSSCPWTVLPLGDGPQGATVALQAHHFGPAPTGALVARADIQANGQRLWWSRIEVSEADGRRMCAAATVVYRVSPR